MKALVLAAAIAAAEINEAPLRRAAQRDGDRRAERKRFTDADLREMLGDMEPTPDEPPPALVMPEPDFIRWEPSDLKGATIPEQRSIAA